MDLNKIKEQYPELPIGHSADLTNKKFGHWTALYRTNNDKSNKAVWVCMCDCENHTIKPVSSRTLKNGTSTSCGCQRLKTIKEKSKTFYREYDNNNILIKKKCHCCGEILPITEFWKNKAQLDGYTNKCKKCSRYNLKENKFQYYKKNAKNRNLEFLLNKDEFYNLVQQPCIYCGSTNGETRGIDRINPQIGYISNNVVPCCEICNKMKLNYSKEFWFLHMKQILLYCGEIKL